MPEEEVQHIKVRIDQFDTLVGEAADDDYLLGWDTSLGKTVKIPVAQLPFDSGGGGGGGSGTTGSPFKVTIDSDTWSFEGGNTIIQDPRLLGQDDAVVQCTQIGFELRADKLVFDADNGILTILGLDLQDGEHITIITKGTPTLQQSELVTAFEARLDLLEKMLAPIKPLVGGPNYARYWWMGPIDQIPEFWAEDVSMRGYLPLPYDPDEDDPMFEDIKVIGNTLGANKHTNTLEEAAPHEHELDEKSTGGDWKTTSGSGTPLTPVGVVTPRVTRKAGGWIDPDGDPVIKVAKPYSILNKSKTGCWIYFVGE